MRFYTVAFILSAVASQPALAQAIQGVSQTNADGDTTTVFTIAPSTGVSATDYVKITADSLNYEIAAANQAQTKAQRDDVKAFAKQALDHASTAQKTLMAALTNSDRKITRPPMTLSSQRASDVDLLRKAPRGSFDTLYLSQHLKSAPMTWALQSGYASDGTDQALKQVAASMVPTIEQDYRSARSLLPAGAQVPQ